MFIVSPKTKGQIIQWKTRGSPRPNGNVAIRDNVRFDFFKQRQIVNQHIEVQHDIVRTASP